MMLAGQYLEKYLYESALAETSDKYTHLGYQVVRAPQVEDISADLLATKDGKDVYFTISVGKVTEEQKQNIMRIKKFIRSKNAEFRLIHVATPQKPQLQIDNLKEILYDYLLENPPGIVDTLSTNTHITDLSNVEVTDLEIKANRLYVCGICSLTLSLHYGSASDLKNDLGFRTTETYDAEFDMEMDGDLKVLSLDMKVDV